MTGGRAATTRQSSQPRSVCGKYASATLCVGNIGRSPSRTQGSSSDNSTVSSKTCSPGLLTGCRPENGNPAKRIPRHCGKRNRCLGRQGVDGSHRALRSRSTAHDQHGARRAVPGGPSNFLRAVPPHRRRAARRSRATDSSGHDTKFDRHRPARPVGNRRRAPSPSDAVRPSATPRHRATSSRTDPAEYASVAAVSCKAGASAAPRRRARPAPHSAESRRGRHRVAASDEPSSPQPVRSDDVELHGSRPATRAGPASRPAPADGPSSRREPCPRRATANTACPARGSSLWTRAPTRVFSASLNDGWNTFTNRRAADCRRDRRFGAGPCLPDGHSPTKRRTTAPFFCSTHAWSFFRYGLDRVSSMPCSLQTPINTSLSNSLPLPVSIPRNGKRERAAEPNHRVDHDACFKHE